MNCKLCEGTGKVARVRNGSKVDMITCPQCVRGVATLGTHEMLRDKRGRIHQPGEAVTPTGTLLNGWKVKE